MICLKTWKEITNENWDEFQKFQNENYIYSQTKSKPFDWIGKCRVTDLPSHHPYWNFLVMRDYKKAIIRFETNYNKCRKDRMMLKYLFDAKTTLRDVAKIIETKKCDLEQFKIERGLTKY